MKETVYVNFKRNISVPKKIKLTDQKKRKHSSSASHNIVSEQLNVSVNQLLNHK